MAVQAGFIDTEMAALVAAPKDQELIYPPVQEFWDDAIKGSS